MRTNEFKPRFGEVTIRDRGRLPHWEVEGGTYFVTIRLGDSLPQSLLESIRFERKDILQIYRICGLQSKKGRSERLEVRMGPAWHEVA